MSYPSIEQSIPQSAERPKPRNPIVSEMSFRDYFAAKAMQSYLNGDDRDSFTNDEWAKASYRMADAMLKAREA